MSKSTGASKGAGLRVVAGELRGRKLAVPPGDVTRPTSQRVREAVFSMLGDVDGCRVLDLFAGTGALGIEAISRGASEAVFVESHPAALAAIRANLAALRLRPPRAVLRAEDASNALQSAYQRREAYDLVFFDPPYRAVPALSDQICCVLPRLLSAVGAVVVESDAGVKLPLTLPIDRQRRYRNTSITIHRRPRL